ncbi:MAG: glycosyltransferase family 87 protein, partial [Planctomycetota bacterium]|nr:glycosyltransferase family 87 protein [Planctomycetota bacterium]
MTNDKTPSVPMALEIAPIANRRMHWLRVGLWVLVGFVLLAPTVQAQLETAKRQRAREAATRPQDAKGAARDKEAKGALTRWRTAVEEFWTPGKNIYVMPPVNPSPNPAQRTSLHPNMPFTVILLTPFARMPVWAMVLSWNLLKIVAAVASLFMLARVVSHGPTRVPDWVMLLAFAWAAPMIAGDLQHANTNMFVLVVVALLWLYRKGADYLAGVPLALAVCLKMTPALFLAYWLYQRNVRLLVGAMVALVLFVAVVPGAMLGQERATELTMMWWHNLIRPGLAEGRAYPIHINQSIPGVFQRLLIGPPQKEGDISWNSDDDPYYLHHARGDKEADTPEWIALANLSPAQARHAIQAAQLAIVLLGLWGVGWRTLARDDGRRGLHYALLVIGMMLLNQRTWDHHATVMLVAGAGVWYALAA